MKKFLLFIFFASTLFALSSFYKANAQCTSCSDPFPWSCQYGTMCCHRSGCPSYVCFAPIPHCQSLHGSGATGSWIWVSSSHDSYIRCYPTPTTFVNYTGTRCDEGCISCGGVGDDDGAASAYIVGRVWEDKNGNGYLDQPNEVWGPSTVSCKGNTHNGFRLQWDMEGFGDLITDSNWACNNGGGVLGSTAYYQTPPRSHILEGSGSDIRFTSVPAGYEIAKWDYTICRGEPCSDPANHNYYAESLPSGVTTLQRRFPRVVDGGLAADANNHLWFQIRPSNSAPTASITTPTGCPGPLVRPAGTNIPISVLSQDTDSNLSSIGLYRRPWLPATASYTDPFTAIGIATISGSSATSNFAFTSPTAGWYVLYPNVYDSLGAWCSGLPYHTNDCAPTTAEASDTDNCKLYVNSAPVWRSPAVRAPTRVRVNNVAMVNADAYDPNYNLHALHINSHQVRTSWSATCGTFPSITTLRIRARGTLDGGVGPLMRVYRGNLSGASAPYAQRTQICQYNVTTTSTTYSCPVGSQYSALDISFENDSNVYSDRNLFIDWVELVQADGTVTRIQAENGSITPPVGSTDAPLIAWMPYDRGTPFNLNTSFDGVDNYFQAAGPTELGMYWNGALRLGPLWKAPATGTSCTVSAAVSDRYQGAGTGGSGSIALCGIAPLAPSHTCPSPIPEYQYSSTLTVPLTWNSVSNWGLPCPTLNRTYKFYLKRPSDADFFLAQTVAHNTSNPTTHTWTYAPPTYGTYEWRVVANNGEMDSVPSSTCSFNVEPAPLPGWVTSIDGDVYAPGITQTFPETPHSNWSGTKMKLARGLSTGTLGTVFSGSAGGKLEMYVYVNPGLRYDLVSQSNKWARYMPVANMWPLHFTNASSTPWFTPPSVVTSRTNFNYDPSDPTPLILNRNTIYRITSTSAFSGEKFYDLDGPGVAVIYYDGTSNITINNSIRHISNDPNERILLITNKNVTITDIVGVTDPPAESTRANIEMGIITTGTVSFPRKTTLGTDITAVVEGPLVAANSISFLRSRGIMPTYNMYPSEVVRYNSNYLYRLTTQERSSTVPNSSGLFEYKIIWEAGK